MANVKNTKDDVDVSVLYGQECTLPKDEFIKKYHVKEGRFIFT